jgi:CHAT domain-containing protein
VIRVLRQFRKESAFVVWIGADQRKWFVKSCFNRKAFLLSVSAFALLSSIGLARLVTSGHRSSPTVLANSPKVLLERANYLSWLNNWNAAGPLYARAEILFRADGDTRNELYARIGRIRAYGEPSSGQTTSQALEAALRQPVTTSDAKLRLWCLAVKGYIELDLNSADAKRAWTEALQIANSLGESRWATRASGELGIIAFLEGNTASAVSLVGKAILSAYRTGDIGEQVRLLSLLGSGFNEERRFSEALTIFNRAIAISEKTPDAGFPFLAYRGKAAALIGLHQSEQAQHLLATALTTAQSQNSLGDVADILVALGEATFAANDLGQAKARLTEAGQIASRLDLSRTLSYAMFDLATVDRQLGDMQGAMVALRTGLKASRRLGDRYYVPRDLTALAELKAAANHITEADRLFEEAEDVLDGILINQHSFEESTARAGSMSNTYLEHFRLVQKSGDVARSLQVLERVRGRIVASHLYAREKFESKSPKLAPLEANIAATQLALLRTEDVKQRSVLLERLLEDERNLAFESNEAGLNRQEMLAKPASLKIIQAALRKDELLVEYVLDEPHSFCVAISRESARILTLSADSKQIQTLTQSFLAELKSRGTGEQLGSELYSLLLEPALRLFHKPRLIISPDGILNSLPFEALQSHGDLVIRSKEVSYVPSATVLCELRDRAKPEGGHSLLAVGAVDYKIERTLPADAQRGTVAAAIVRGIEQLSGAHLEDLPGSRDEVISIAHIVGHDPTLMLAEDATESAFKSAPLSDFRVIHLAVHAAADPQYPDRAALVLGVAPQTTDDGLLQVREIMRLPLNADLVTLSACETGVGTARGESGVVSLEQAFLISGARAVVASLWNVEDRSTTALMKAFYGHIARGEDKVSALANAKRDMMDRYKDISPYYWAPFVLVGEGAEAVSDDR